MGNRPGADKVTCADGVRTASASSFEIDFYYRHVRCRERINLPITQRNANYCAKLKAGVEVEIAKGTFDYRKHFPESPKVKQFSALPGDTLSVEQHITMWLETERLNVRHSTWQGYKQVVHGYIIPIFGSHMLSDLKRRHVKEWLATRTDITPKTLGNILSPLRIALDDAVESELIEVNPLAGWRLKRRSTSKTNHVDPFSVAEREAILAAAEGQNRNLLQFAFWTGLRTSELAGLDWTQIDWLRGSVRISFVLTPGMREPEEAVKTKAGERDVKLLPPALEAITAQKAFNYLKGKEVFQNPRTGDRWLGAHPIGLMWGTALRKAGVRYRNPYQTRHTYASMMLMAGESPMWVAAQMGHTDWAFTVRTYSRWIPSDATEAGNKAVALWSAFGQSATAKR